MWFMKNAAQMVQALLLMAMYGFLPFVLVFSRYDNSMILESSVEQVEGYVCGGVGQGIRTRNSCSIPRSYNVAIHRRKRAIRPVASFTHWVKNFICANRFANNALPMLCSGQLRIPG